MGVALGSTGFRSHATRTMAVRKIQTCLFRIKLVTVVFRSRRVVAVKCKPCDTHCVSLAIAIAVSLIFEFPRVAAH